MSKKPKMRVRDRGSVRFIKGLFRFIIHITLGAAILLVMMNLSELGLLGGFGEKFNAFLSWLSGYIKVGINWVVPYIKIAVDWIVNAFNNIVAWVKNIFA